MPEIKTRLALRYDTFTNWNSKNPTLLKGEVAIASLSTENYKDSSFQGATPHPVMMKVGDGSHTFKELPWTSAYAADVYAWAKQENLPIISDGTTGNVITNIVWDATNKSLKVSKAQVALSSELTALEGRVSTIESTYATDADLEREVSAINAEIDKKANKSYVDDELAKYHTLEAQEAYATATSTAINTAKEGAIAAAKTETENQVKALSDGQVTTNKNDISDLKTLVSGTGTTSVASRLSALENNKADKSELTAAVGEINTELAKKALQSDLTDEINRAKEAEAKALTDAKDYTDDREVALKEYADDAVAVEKGRAEGAETALSGRIDTLDTTLQAIIDDKDGSTLNSIKDLATWVEEHEGDVTNMVGDINEHSAVLNGFDSEATDGTATVKGYVDAKVLAEKTRAEGAETALGTRIDNITNGTTKVESAANADLAAKANSLTDAAKAEVKAVKVDNATNADQLGGKAASLYALTETVSGNLTALESSLKTYADGKASAAETAAKSAAALDATNKANTAETNAKNYTDTQLGSYYTKTEAEAKFIDSGELTAEINSAKYITSVESTEFKVTDGKLSINTDTVFVFNCGDASGNYVALS